MLSDDLLIHSTDWPHSQWPQLIFFSLDLVRIAMDLRWLKITLRVAAAVLLVVTAIRFALGDLSFHMHEDATPPGYSVDSVIVIGHIPLILFCVSAVFLVLSFVIPPKRV
jgi:hypothetical protein